MRIWSIHPRYLDSKGLVAVWRETLLAKNVLENKTTGYRHHPQLTRFKQSPNALDSINQYLSAIYAEATRRKYSFNKEKVNWGFKTSKLTVTSSQLTFEMDHLKTKLKSRDSKKFKELRDVTKIKPHPLFRIISGEIETWEKK